MSNQADIPHRDDLQGKSPEYVMLGPGGLIATYDTPESVRHQGGPCRTSTRLALNEISLEEWRRVVAFAEVKMNVRFSDLLTDNATLLSFQQTAKAVLGMACADCCEEGKEAFPFCRIAQEALAQYTGSSRQARCGLVSFHDLSLLAQCVRALASVPHFEKNITE